MSVICNEVVDDIEDILSSKSILQKKKSVNKINILQNDKLKEKFILPEIQRDSSVIPGTQLIYIKTWGCSHNNSDSEYMAGQLVSYGYKLTDNKLLADVWLLNSCTVKNPAEDHFRNEIEKAKYLGKRIVVTGCVSQAAPKSKFLQDLSIIGVQHIDRIVEVVEETVKGNTVQILSKKKDKAPSLTLPKVRKNPHIEIIPISTGCLNQCTYCKTKHARGELGSYLPDEIINRAKQAFEEGVCELWITSEDTGAYGRDIGSNLPKLLRKLIDVIPDGCRLRIGMTNPPYILEHLEEMCQILQNEKIYRFLHIPVQSGSNNVLFDMKREYTLENFKYIVNFLKSKIPDITITTDIICGFPTETLQDFEQTLDLCKQYKFPSLFINQFFARPGTPAAKMIQIPSKDIKRRTKKLHELFQSYTPYTNRIGEIQDILVTEISQDKKYYVGHNKCYEQVLIPMEKNYLGQLLTVKIISSTKYSMKGIPTNKSKLFALKELFFKIKVPYKIIKNNLESVCITLVVLLFYIFYCFVKSFS